MNLEEVARLAGVSRSTVSRVVNGDAKVSASVRARVQDVVREHGYHPNAAARSLASRRTRILGLLIPRASGAIFSDPFFPVLIQGAVDACNHADHNLMLLMDTDEEAPTAEGSRLHRRVLRGRHLDGVAVAASVVDDPVVALLRKERLPFVLIGRHPDPAVAYVDADNRGGSRAAVAHLVAHGRRRIATIAGPRTIRAGRDRLDGYRDALAAAKLPSNPALIGDGDFSRRDAHRATHALFGQPP